MKRALVLCLIIVAAYTTACQTVTMVKDPQSKTAEEPNWQDSQSFFLFGLIGEKYVDVSKTCNNQPPAMVVAQNTFLDGFLGVITLGIYTPRSLKVWCVKGDS